MTSKSIATLWIGATMVVGIVATPATVHAQPDANRMALSACDGAVLTTIMPPNGSRPEPTAAGQPAMASPSTPTAVSPQDLEACVRIWADSLRSNDAVRLSMARNALALVGGRTAVDALRLDYERTPSKGAKMATMIAMGTTGSVEDVTFLSAQLQGPFTGLPIAWPEIQLAANTLGLLRAVAGRDSLASALARNSPAGFAGRAVTTALANMGRPPCADSVRGPLEATLVRIVVRCGLPSMEITQQYQDQDSHGVWLFTGNEWRLDPPRAVPDSASPFRLTTTVSIAPDGNRAEVITGTWCGRLCGEGWTYRLLRSGGVWRVVAMSMGWVS